MEPNNQNIPESRKEVVVRERNNTVSFLALAVAVAALVLAWVVFTNQPGEDFKNTVQEGADKMDQKMESAAEKTGDTTREAAGAVVEKTGEAMEATGEAAQQMGTDIKKDGEAMPR